VFEYIPVGPLQPLVGSATSASDPCPQIPETFIDPTRILKLAREIHTVPAGLDGVAEPEAEPTAGDETATTDYEPPTIQTR
jgi:hypothetical protein